jgi:hypothetical protein
MGLYRAVTSRSMPKETSICSEGKELKRYRRAFSTPRDGVRKDGTIGYRASKFDCETCPLKSKCCPNAVARRIARSIYEAARDKAERSQRRLLTSSHAESGRRSRCCLRISSASSG